MRIPWPAPKTISAQQQLPPVRLVAIGEFTDGSFVAPNAWHRVNAETPEGELVGRVSYGVSPLRDRIYVDGLHVERHQRRKGYGTSILVEVAKVCPSVPITALHEVQASKGFWSKLRLAAAPDLTVTLDVRLSEMTEEARRWKSV